MSAAPAEDLADDLADDLAPHRVVVNAAAAPRPQTQAPNSVFQVGERMAEGNPFLAQAFTAPTSARAPVETRFEAALAVLQREGHASSVLLRKALSLTFPQVSRLIEALVAAGRIEEASRKGREVFWRVRTVATNWASPPPVKKAKAAPKKQTADRPAARKPAGKAAARKPVPKEPPTTAVAPTLTPTWSGAIAHDGHVVLNAGGVQLQLAPAQAAAAAQWMARAAAAAQLLWGAEA